MEKYRICCVCLNGEGLGERFASVIGNKIAKTIFNVSGQLIVDLKGGMPSLICTSCENDVKSAESVKIQIIKGQKKLQEMQTETEVKMIQKNRKKLVLDQPSFPYVLSKSTLTKVDEWKKNRILLQGLKSKQRLAEEPERDPLVKTEPVSPQRRDSFSEVEFVSKELAIKREKQPAIPVKKFTGKKENQPMVVIRDLDFLKPSVPGIKKEKLKVSKPLRYKNSTRRKQAPTSFECDSCKQCFPSFDDLNTHMESHNKPVDDEADPKLIFDTPPMIISQVHEAGTFSLEDPVLDDPPLVDPVHDDPVHDEPPLLDDPALGDSVLDDVILIPPTEPEVINLADDDDEEDIETLLQELY